jgi:hypothetical protein
MLEKEKPFLGHSGALQGKGKRKTDKENHRLKKQARKRGREGMPSPL